MPEDDGVRRRNWRYRERRSRAKVLAKRVSQEDYDLILAYAKSLNVTVAGLLDPAVTELVSRARAHIATTAAATTERGDHRQANT